MIDRDIFTGKLLINKSEKLTFGKYKNRTISTVMILDKQYLLWAINSDNRYSISDTWRQYILENVIDESKIQYAGSYNIKYYKEHIKG